MSTLNEIERYAASELGFSYGGIVSTPNENPHFWQDESGKWVNEDELKKLINEHFKTGRSTLDFLR